MISFPNCKINIGLYVVEKRTDGFHDLETVFYPLPLHDILEILPVNNAAALAGVPDDPAPGIPDIELSGLPVDGDPARNLCIKAWRLLKADHPALPIVRTLLYKKIPMGAGLGGGSADGAFMLKMLNDHFRLGISEEQLATYALALGSDCPFFLLNKPAFATGRGERTEVLNLDLSSYSFLVINPGIHISTAEGFAGITASRPAIDLRDAILQPVEKWKELISNDFEISAFQAHPQLKRIKEFLYGSGALYASMTGTGSCFYGIFDHPDLPDHEGAIKIPSGSR